MSLHVCHLAKYYPPAAGGIETHVQALARSQRELGMQVTVLAINHQNSEGTEIFNRPLLSTPACESDDQGVRVLRAARLCAVSKWDCSPKLVRRIRGLQTGESRIDLLHLHTPNATMALALYAAGAKVPLVVTHHSDIVKQRVLGRALSLFENRLLEKATVILSTSPVYPAGSAQLRRRFEKVESLPLGIDLQPFLTPSATACRHRDELRSRFPGPLWICVGRLVYYKGFNTAIEALTTLPGTLLIVGEGPLRRELEQHAVSLGVAGRVVFMGKASADELAGAYHAATALLFPSNARSEAFGIVQVEAMASGCPVVNTDIPNSGVAWVSRDNETGLTVPINAPAELAAAAQRLAYDAELRRRLSEAGKLRAAAEFSDKAMAERSREVYERAMSCGRSEQRTDFAPIRKQVSAGSECA